MTFLSSDRKDIYNIRKISISTKCCSFKVFIIQRIFITVHCFYKIIKTPLLSTLMIIIEFLKHYYILYKFFFLESFLKDHVTLKIRDL